MSTFVQQLHERYSQAQTSGSEVIEKVNQLAMFELTHDFTAKAELASDLKKTQTSLRTWSARYPAKYCGYSLIYLLSNTNLLQKLQSWFDTNYGDGNFKVYYTVPTKLNRNMNVFVSWDANRFNEIDLRMERIRESNRRRSERRQADHH